MLKHVFRWDLDKTYLRTEFDSVRDLVKTALETARDKQAYPGAAALLRALRQTEGHRICIISGSPRQMKRVLAAKLALDGITYDEFVLKDNLRNLLRGRFRAMRSQVPYKLPALLASRAAMTARAAAADASPRETMCGDDAESDAVIYSLYADLLTGALDIDELPRILAAARAYPDQIDETMALVGALPRSPPATAPVQRILIHLDRRSPTGQFARFGPRLVPIFNYFQAALVLHADGVLTARQLLFVAREMLAAGEHPLSTLATSLQDLIRRGRIRRDAAVELARECEAAADAGALAGVDGLPPFDQIAAAFTARVRELGDAPPLEHPAADPQLDYFELVDADHRRRR
jgi:hypothetical protein